MAKSILTLAISHFEARGEGGCFYSATFLYVGGLRIEVQRLALAYVALSYTSIENDTPFTYPLQQVFLPLNGAFSELN